MSKRTITLEAIDHLEIYGAANKNLEALCSYFPELKVVARGCEIILDGKEEDVERFAQKLQQLIERRHHKMNITPYDVEDLFDGESSPDRFKLCGNSVIVHGNDGKPLCLTMAKLGFSVDIIASISVTLLRRAAVIISRTSRAFDAKGFSHNTCLP